MKHLDTQGERLLALLVQRLAKALPGRPETYISYMDVHTSLGLSQLGPTYGESLKHQGLVNLADWTAATGKPAITGLIVGREDRMPGEGYFRLFSRKADDFKWWRAEIERSKNFDWSPHLSSMAPQEPPTAIDIKVPERAEVTTYRILRDTVLSKRLKQLHHYECQLCRHTIILTDGSRYAEAHHIKPLGHPHNGPDIAENIICLCPNHHAELDFAVRALTLDQIRRHLEHSIGEEFVQYHNEKIHGVAA